MPSTATTDKPVDLLVVGGGISGLATAWFAHQAGWTVQVLEAAPQAGGKIRSFHEAGYLVEGGPNSLLASDPSFDTLVAGLGLQAALIEANAAARRRYVLKDGRLQALPTSPLAFLRTPLFSPRGKLRLLAEPFIGKARHEESLAEFVTRRLGREFLDWAIDPFVSGVYAGDPQRLSVRAATPKVYALEAEHGSLLRGALARMRERQRGLQTGPAGRMVSFRDGMQTLPAAIAAALGEALATNTPVEALRRDATRCLWTASGPAGQWRARQVVLAVPAAAAARLLDGAAAPALEAIPYPAVASVALGFRRDQVAHALDGFGFLIPGRVGLRTLGALFSSTLFPGRAPAGHVLITAFTGGRRHPELAELSDDALLEVVLGDLRGPLGLRGAPVFTRLTRWAQAIPQYELGHGQRLQQVQEQVARQPGLHLRANWLDGISVGDCVRNAARLVTELTEGK